MTLCMYDVDLFVEWLCGTLRSFCLCPSSEVIISQSHCVLDHISVILSESMLSGSVQLCILECY